MPGGAVTLIPAVDPALGDLKFSHLCDFLVVRQVFVHCCEDMNCGTAKALRFI